MSKWILISSFFILFSCANSKNTNSISFSNDENICNMNVSFRSQGAGVDRKSYRMFLAFIEKFEAEENVKLKVEQIFWGREGEMDYCFHYVDLNEKQIIKFEKGIKELFVESQTVYFSKETEKRKGR